MSLLRCPALATALCLLSCASAFTQTPTIVKDINTTADASFSSRPGPPVAFNGSVYFEARASEHVSGLWRSDGTTVGTELIREMEPSVLWLDTANGFLFFPDDSGGLGRELFRLDADGNQVLVRDIYPGPGSGFVWDLIGVGDVVFFGGTDGTTGTELWKSDGTLAGTVLVKDINPTGDSDPTFITSIDGVVYFTAEDGVNGRELWRSDGMAAGTMLVKDIRPGAESSSLGSLFAVRMGDQLLFEADDGVHGSELWRTDGTAAGTGMVVDLNPGEAPGVSSAAYIFRGRVFDGLLYFAADNGDGSGRGLWVSDGTSAGTTRVMSNVLPVYFYAAEDSIYFLEGVSTRNQGLQTQGKLWKSDGALVGAQVVKEFGVRVEANLTSFGGEVYFSANDGGPEGNELWKTDGSEAGTVLIQDIQPEGSSNPGLLTVIEDVLFFNADDGEHGEELWRSNGSAEGTVLVKDLGAEVGSSNPSNFTRLGTELLFTANDGIRGQELWKTDGTDAGTTLVKDIHIAGASGPSEAVLVGQAGYFTADDGVHGRELWRSDGTEAGTLLVKDILPGEGSALPKLLTRVGSLLYFVANNGVSGQELWRTDGTDDGTRLVQDIAADEQSSEPDHLLAVGGTLFFVADDGITGRELWKSDGTADGTVMVKNIRADGPLGSEPNHLTDADGTLFFVAFDGTERGLWKSDGSEGGTVLLADLDDFGNVNDPVAVGGTLFFFVEYSGSLQSPPQDTALWRSDGTPDSTGIVTTFPTIFPPEVSAQRVTVGPLVEYGHKLYFMAGTPYTDWGLWESDGTEAGTVMVKSLVEPGEAGPPNVRTSYGGALFYTTSVAAPNSPNRYLGRTHGTAETTTTYATAFNTSVGPVVGLGAQVFFAGHTGEFGRELWSVPLRPEISTGGVVDAAGFKPTLAPGGLGSLFGAELAAETTHATTLPLPTTLGDVRVRVNGVDAPLLMVSPMQINFQAPYETPIGGSTSIVAVLNGEESLSEPTEVAEFAPALFVNPSSGEPIIQRHPDGALITSGNPAKPGDILTLYVTGIGGLTNPPATGSAASANPLSTATVAATVTVGGVEATVLFAGLTPNFAGLGQINIVLPENLTPGSPIELVIKFAGAASKTVELPF